MAESYYKVIDGEKYDRSLLEQAEKIIDKADVISETDAKKIVENALDGKGITDTEAKTLRYIVDNFHLTAGAKYYIENLFSDDKKKKGGFGWLFLILLLLLLLLLLFFGLRACECPASKEKNIEPVAVVEPKSEPEPIQEEPKSEPEPIQEEPKEKAKAFINSTVATFELNGAKLNTTSKENLKKIAGILKENPDMQVEVRGYSCKLGSDKTNQKLSVQRAQHVADFLTERGIDSSRLKVLGKGSQDPVNTGTSETDLSENRRVEIKTIK